ncbi:hypothetical protein C2L66_34485 [Paraburkholderia caribensis]|nr:hypothetical protein C2L66_34485 [Paraburkholderia caribensis]
MVRHKRAGWDANEDTSHAVSNTRATRSIDTAGRSTWRRAALSRLHIWLRAPRGPAAEELLS